MEWTRYRAPSIGSWLSPGPDRQMRLADVEVSELRRDEIPAAAEVVALAMCDNPTQVDVHGGDRARRVRHLRAMGKTILRTRREPGIAAREDGAIVGLVSAVEPGGCSPPAASQLRTLPLFFRLGPRTAARLAAYGSDWVKHDPREPHWHVGPVAVRPDRQGRGVGSEMMAAFCRRMEERGGTVYLETDKEENVPFYRKFGFEVIEEADLLSVRHWFMRRAF